MEVKIELKYNVSDSDYKYNIDMETSDIWDVRQELSSQDLYYKLLKNISVVEHNDLYTILESTYVVMKTTVQIRIRISGSIKERIKYIFEDLWFQDFVHDIFYKGRETVDKFLKVLVAFAR